MLGKKTLTVKENACRPALVRSFAITAGILITVLVLTQPCMAIEPAWTYPYTHLREVSDLSIPPDGSSVIAAAGKVLLFSKNGTILQRELFGDRIYRTSDGSSVVSSYATTVYTFSLASDTEGQPNLKKEWETELPDTVSSCSMDELHRYIVVRPQNGDVYLYDAVNGTLLYHWTEYSDLIAVSPGADYIAGISVNQGLKIYLGYGDYDQKFDVPLKNLPKDFFAVPGAVVVYNDGQHIAAVNATNGTEIWRVKASDDVNMLSMTDDKQFIVTGTQNGGIDLVTGDGKPVWSYQSRTGPGSQGIEAVAISADASRILAGSYDGKIILLNRSGHALWTYTIPAEHIWHVAIAADGSLAAAAGDNTMYVFFLQDDEVLTAPGDVPYITDAGNEPSLNPEETDGGISGEPSLSIPVVTGTPSEIPTAYSVIRTETKSPLQPTTLVIALLIVAIYICRQRDA